MVVGDAIHHTQLLVIGGGSGGYVAAIRAAQLGKKVVLVEKSEMGGVLSQLWLYSVQSPDLRCPPV